MEVKKKGVIRTARRTFRNARATLARAIHAGSEGGVTRNVSPEPAPGPNGKLRVHLGCGSLELPGWFNVDERWFPHIHLVGSVEQLDALPDEAAEVVYASHVLEHVSHRQTIQTLKEWSRILAPGGELFIAVPDFDAMVQRYIANDRRVDAILGPLMGEQDYPANTHRAAFNRANLTELLQACGFGEVRPFLGAEIIGATLWDNSKHELSLNLAARRN